MVRKEELCSWFKDLSPHKRIDYLCGMLHICLPLELRFVGSYVEDLAKKDFVHLREHEGKANSRDELSKFNEIEAKSFRTKMAIYLALLRSSNRTCSSIIYQLLENNIKQALTVMDNMDKMTVHNILLVLSMAMNHPAFSYHQKTKMFDYYNMANEVASQLFREDQVHREPELRIPSLILSESCETRGCDQRLSPAISPLISFNTSQAALSPNHKVFVTQIEVKGSRPRELENGKAEYELQVTWSNGEKKEVFKTYQEILDFQTKLKQKFPEEPSIHLQAGLNNDVSGQKNHRGDVTDQLNIMAKSFSNLPPHIQHCCLFAAFFDASFNAAVQMTDASTSPRLQNGLDLSMVPNQSNNIGDINSLSPHSPAQIELGCNGSAHSPSCSTKTTSPLISSPSCQSPVSSVESPLNSNASSPSPNDAEPNSIANHLRSHDLADFKNLLERFNTEQLQQMRDEELESHGLPREVLANLKESLRQKKMKGPHIPNGLVDSATPTVFMYPPPPHFLPPPNMPNPGHFHHPFHPPLYQNVYGFHPFPNHLVTGVQQDMSPTNSEYSSPSQSPHLPVGGNRIPANVPITDSSSDDSERDKHPGHHQKPGSKWGKAHPVTSSRINPSDQGREDMSRQDTNANSGTQAINCDSSGSSAKPSYHSSSGYTSDPTYNAPRPQMVRPPVYNKALPAHTNIAIPQKCIINMPENFKGGPMSIPQHLRDVTMTTGTNLHGYGMISADPSQRPLFPVVCGHPAAVLNRSHLNYVPKQVLQPGLLASAQTQSQTGPQMNGSSNNNAGKIVAGAPGLVLPIPPPVTLTTPQTVTKNNISNVNSSEAVSGHGQTPPSNDSSASIRVSVIAGSSTATSTSISQSVAGQSHPTNHCVQTSRSSCTSCGCPGHNSSATAINYMPHIQQNLWPLPNGLIPFHGGMYMPHAQYINGVNHEHMYNHPYPVVNQGGQSVGGSVPNYVYGYNFYNSNPNPSSNGGYSKKPKKIFCSNCGSNKHMAVDCTETTMEAMSGHIKYSYKNDSD